MTIFSLYTISLSVSLTIFDGSTEHSAMAFNGRTQIKFIFGISCLLPCCRHTLYPYHWDVQMKSKSKRKVKFKDAIALGMDWSGSFEVVVLFFVVVVFRQDELVIVSQVNFHAVFGPDSFQSVWSANKLYHFNGWQRTLKIIPICIIFPFRFFVSRTFTI